MSMERAYCAKCNLMYEVEVRAFPSCPFGHKLQHPHTCDKCGEIFAYFQVDDDYCGPEAPLCARCVEKALRGKV